MSTFEITSSNHCTHFVVGAWEGQRSFSPSAPGVRWSARCVCSEGRRWHCWIWLFLSWPVWLSGGGGREGEEEVTASDRVGGRSQKMTNTFFNGENLPTHHTSPVVILSDSTVLLLHSFSFHYIREENYCVLCSCCDFYSFYFGLTISLLVWVF